jgi:hypothetical protein
LRPSKWVNHPEACGALGAGRGTYTAAKELTSGEVPAGGGGERAAAGGVPRTPGHKAPPAPARMTGWVVVSYQSITEACRARPARAWGRQSFHPPAPRLYFLPPPSPPRYKLITLLVLRALCPACSPLTPPHTRPHTHARPHFLPPRAPLRFRASHPGVPTAVAPPVTQPSRSPRAQHVHPRSPALRASGSPSQHEGAPPGCA